MATIDSLRRKKARLEAQLAEIEREIAALDRVPTQTTMAIAPAPATTRKRTVHEENHDEFQNSRRVRLAAIGVDYVPDEQNPVAFIVVTMHKLRKVCADDAELFRLIDAYLAETWPARFAPPYPLRGLAAEKTWSRLLAQIRATPAAVTA